MMMEKQRTITVYDAYTGEWIADCTSKQSVMQIVGAYANQYNFGICRMWYDNNTSYFDTGKIVLAADANLF